MNLCLGAHASGVSCGCWARRVLPCGSLRLGGTIAVFLAFQGLAAAQGSSELAELFAKYHLKQNIIKPPKGLLKHPCLVPAGPYFQLFD